MFAYRLLLTLSWLAVPFVLLARIATGKDSTATALARLTLGPRDEAAPGALWLHAASVGELNTLRLLIAPLRRALPDVPLLVTTGNRLAYERATALRREGIAVAIAPLDHRSVVARFVNRWQPRALITVENEVYPNRILTCAARGIPVIYVNARMSARSHRAWARRPRLAGPVFAAIDFCFAQDQTSLDRFADLGVPAARLSCPGNLKQFQPAEVPDHPDLAPLHAAFDPAMTLLAASTHKGEDAIVLEAFRLARTTHPGLKLILAPRHPKRGGEIAALIGAAGLTFARRSASALPDAQTDVYLADTMGEMALWYASAAVTFVAGSLVPVGGHTPYEPAAQGSAILHGPLYSNFQAIYDALVAAGGSRQVGHAAELAAAWGALLDPATRARQVAAAQVTLFEGGDRERIFNTITGKISELL